VFRGAIDVALIAEFERPRPVDAGRRPPPVSASSRSS
jgi:hypothetical protein